MFSQNNNKLPPKNTSHTVASEWRTVLYHIVHAQCCLLLICRATPAISCHMSHVYTAISAACITYIAYAAMCNLAMSTERTMCVRIVSTIFPFVGWLLARFAHWNALYSIEKAYSHRHMPVRTHKWIGCVFVCVPTYYIRHILPFDWHMVSACLWWFFPRMRVYLHIWYST